MQIVCLTYFWYSCWVSWLFICMFSSVYCLFVRLLFIFCWLPEMVNKDDYKLFWAKQFEVNNLTMKMLQTRLNQSVSFLDTVWVDAYPKMTTYNSADNFYRTLDRKFKRLLKTSSFVSRALVDELYYMCASNNKLHVLLSSSSPCSCSSSSSYYYYY